MEFKSISYAITVCNEYKEFADLYVFLRDNIDHGDEIVVQFDSENSSEESKQIIPAILIDAGGNEYERKPSLTYVEFPLNNHFGKFKNNLKKNCSKDYIFQIDADEKPSLELIKQLPGILAQNPEPDLFHVPRCNTVDGLTEAHIKKWGWNIDELGHVNWPDWQPRIIKNLPHIKWDLPVHETIINCKKIAQLPALMSYALSHPKTIEKQESQNNFYDTFHQT